MTPHDSSEPRAGRRRLAWSVGAVAAALVAALFVAMAAGLFGGSSAAGPPRAEPSGAALPSTTPGPAPAEAEPLTLPRSVPLRLRIPSIDVDSDLMSLGLQKDGTLEVPPGAFPAGWFTGAPTPGELGPAIIAGHVRFKTPGVFERLTELRRDDEISVAREDGSSAVFVVTRVERFAKAAFPTRKVYGNIDHAGLRLITCGGLDASTNKFDENVVVFAELKGS